MTFLARLTRLFRRPPRQVVERIALYGARQARAFWLEGRDHLFSSFLSTRYVPAGRLRRHMPDLSDIDLSMWREVLARSATSCLSHRFDLLGSGPVVPEPGLRAPGFEGMQFLMPTATRINMANRASAQRLRACISPAYRRIDWHIDFRSGYRWPAHKPSLHIAYGHVVGVDIKLPWELARLQHLPILALAYLDAKRTGADLLAEKMGVEFQDQILDFLASNPPRFGVNWSCTMDVAIRATNLVVAYDLFLGAGLSFPAAFETEFKRAILTHGRHIISNLEWFADLRSNHYLANIAGLLFIGAYLPSSPETEGWMALAASELGKEILTQFQPDGSNFEGSTSYHRLSAEMIVFSLGLGVTLCNRLAQLDWEACWKQIKSYGPGILPSELRHRAIHALDSDEIFERLEAIGHFSRAITRPDNRVGQIGDNDSGRFLRLTPDLRGAAEADNNHAILIDCIEALSAPSHVVPETIDAMLVRLLRVSAHNFQAHHLASRSKHRASFDDFGLYILAGERLWVSIRCGSVGQLGNGGHAHNDQLSIELCADGVPFFVDPGSYVYTAQIEMRNLFRATHSHTTLSVNSGEQNGWLAGGAGLFSMTRVAKARVVKVSSRTFIGEHDGFGPVHRRSLTLLGTSLEAVDECAAASRVIHFTLAPGVEIRPVSEGLELVHGSVVGRLEIASGAMEVRQAWYSPSYGVKMPCQHIEIRDAPERCTWMFELMSEPHV